MQPEDAGRSQQVKIMVLVILPSHSAKAYSPGSYLVMQALCLRFCISSKWAIIVSPSQDGGRVLRTV